MKNLCYVFGDLVDHGMSECTAGYLSWYLLGVSDRTKTALEDFGFEVKTDAVLGNLVFFTHWFAKDGLSPPQVAQQFVSLLADFDSRVGAIFVKTSSHEPACALQGTEILSLSRFNTDLGKYENLYGT